MPKRDDIHKILVLGSGPIIIGQAAEFDYSGTQACLALQEAGYETVLVNSNPATIMTDETIADHVYLEPLTVEAVTKIIETEHPDAILPTLGGQIGLNLAVALDEAGVLATNGIKLLGTQLTAIDQAEDREKFKALMQALGEPIPASQTVASVAEAQAFAEKIGYPVIVRPAFTMGGTGGGICYDETQLAEVTANGLALSPATQCLIEQSIAGYKEIEFEVMRDAADHAMVVCAMENFDPVGIHTGDSIVVAPTQTLSDYEYQMLRDCALKLIRALKIEGGCNVQLALDPNSFQYYVIEVNPRVSRSSALASKATGYPIAKLAAKIAVGLTLAELKNPVTQTTYAQFEPALDYVVVKIPRWPFDKFTQAKRELGSQMKATGEVMALGRTLEEALLKGIRSLEIDTFDLMDKTLATVSDAALQQQLQTPQDNRLWVIAEAFRRNMTVEQVHDLTHITPYYLAVIAHLVELERTLAAHPQSIASLKTAKRYGFADATIAKLWQQTPDQVRAMRLAAGIKPVYKMVDTCAAEFESATPYFYSTYAQVNESQVSLQPRILVIGSGPIRIGQGVEFDYATVHSVKAIQAMGYEAIVMNSNPETVSTDFSISDKLYFEPLTLEDVLNVIDLEQPAGVVVQFGGQTAINLAAGLAAHGVKILGTQVADLDAAEDREIFDQVIKRLDLKQPQGQTATTNETVIKAAESIGYPVVVRPSYVLGGKAMAIVNNQAELKAYLAQNDTAAVAHPILIDAYLSGQECEVDAICDGEQVLIPGIMEHIEGAGVHSGDSMAVYPPQHLSASVQQQIIRATEQLAVALRCVGIMNLQFIVHQEQVYILEVNPRASRTVPFLSKVTGIPMTQVATKVMLGQSLANQGYKFTLAPKPSQVYVKAPVFSFSKLPNVDPLLGPEMKSTGEVMGRGANLSVALSKALAGAGVNLPATGMVLLGGDSNVTNELKQQVQLWQNKGYQVVAIGPVAASLAKIPAVTELINVEQALILIQQHKIAAVVNTMRFDEQAGQPGFDIRQAAIEHHVPLFTNLVTVSEILEH